MNRTFLLINSPKAKNHAFLPNKYYKGNKTFSLTPSLNPGKRPEKLYVQSDARLRPSPIQALVKGRSYRSTHRRVYRTSQGFRFRQKLCFHLRGGLFQNRLLRLRNGVSGMMEWVWKCLIRIRLAR
ncbi:hypothetical protein NPIL_99081 [Nephila pilipes]|uniref:Uncharacterized protein n=1 Tax=Nephila pilipes TaxID=299642 RepID=A0A8X6MRD0_NEPPI|nr:hypothetical protein NPIL_99081 [Nephila pilipes]